MSIKKLLTLALVLALGVAMLAGCTQTTTTTAATSVTTSGGSSAATTTSAAGGKKVVGVMIASMAAQFQAYIADGMKQEAAKYPNIEFVYVDGKFDNSVQMGQAENFIAQKVDAVIFIPSDNEASVNMVNKLVTAKIPIIGCNTAPKEKDKLISYIGSDTVKSGEILAQGFVELMGGKANLLELQGAFGQEPQIFRHQGIENIFKNNPDMKIIANDTGNWNRDDAMKKMENWLNSDLNGKFDAVIAHNDEMAIGAMKACEAAGVLDKVKIAGIDATPEALNFIKQGKLAFTVFQDAVGQGTQAIDVAARVVNGETVDKEYMIPYVLVTPKDVDTYLAKYEELNK